MTEIQHFLRKSFGCCLKNNKLSYNKIKGVIYFMGEGQDKIARSLLDLEPSAILDLFLVYPDYNSQPDEVFPIHNGSLFKKGVVWQGKTYIPIGLEIDGFELNADGGINRPKIKVANKDYFITSLLKKFNNFKSARIVHKKIFVKYLDDENFDGGNPFGQPDQTAEIFSQKYIIAQKTQENKIFVEFELTSPLDIDNFDVNHRRIMGKYCYWNYRGIGCRYQGPPINKENGDNFKDVDGNVIIPTETTLDQRFSIDREYSVGDVVYIEIEGAEFDLQTEEQENTEESQRNTIKNYYVAKANRIKGFKPNENPKYWDKDGCNKKLSSCQLRFPEVSTITRFVGLGDVEVDSALFTPNAGNSPGGADDILILISATNFDPTFRYTDGATPVIRSTKTWTLAFNFKNIKNRNYYDGIFNTVGGKAGRAHLQLNIQNGAFEFEFVDSSDSSTLKNISVSRPDVLNTEGLNNYPIIVGQKDSVMFMYEPSFNNYIEYDLIGGDIYKDYIDRFIFAKYVKTQTNSDYTACEMNIDSICFWSKALTQAEMDILYRKSIDGGLRAKKYLDIQAEIDQGLTPATVLEQVENWWEGAFTGDSDLSPLFNPAYYPAEINGIRDLIKQDDIYLLDLNQDKLKIDANTYQYNIEQVVTIKESDRYLPFGGFPGTDGFDFSRDA